MRTITTKDGTQIDYKDWGTGRPVIFSHGWPLSGDAWESQMLFLASQGYRCIAHDRRGHGRSSQPWNGNEMDTYADDLAELFKTLDLEGRHHDRPFHRRRRGGALHRSSRHSRVAKAVLVSAVPPLMLKTKEIPAVCPLRFSTASSGLGRQPLPVLQGFAAAFFGFNRPGAKLSQGPVDIFWVQGMGRP